MKAPRTLPRGMIVALLALAAAGLWGSAPRAQPSSPKAPAPLKAPSDFRSIVDPAERSAAIFTEAGLVIQSPRCLNCHPSLRIPTQGDDKHPHVPFMRAGEAGHGPAGMRCTTCHQAANVDTQGGAIRSMPGHAHWGLAPASMAWQGKSLAEICRQIKDPSRNGGRSLAQIHEHMAKDALVGWAWNPGPGRVPAPGTQQVFGSLIQEWIATGAACPAG
jgi:hypothetical protein